MLPHTTTLRASCDGGLLATKSGVSTYVSLLLFPQWFGSSADLIGVMVAHMLPLLMMRHRRIPRAKWRDCSNANGKRWIEQVRAVIHVPVRVA